MKSKSEILAEHSLTPDELAAVSSTWAGRLPTGIWGASTGASRHMSSVLGIIGRLVAKTELKCARFVLVRLPDAAALLELGTGLAPLNWIHEAAGGTGRHDLIIQCTSEAHRAQVETLATNQGLAHARPAPTAAEWWQDSGNTQFPGATEATWRICVAYAETQSTQMRRIILSLANLADFVATVERKMAARVAVLAEMK